MSCVCSNKVSSNLPAVIELMLQSEMHRDWFLHDLERLVIPALKEDKLLVMYDYGDTKEKAHKEAWPTGLFSYAFLNKEQEAGYKDGSKKLTPDIWSNGPDDGMLYVIDFIAPYNNALKVGRFVQKVLTERYIESYPLDGANFIRQALGKRLGYATGVQSELDVRRYCCAV